MLKMCFFACFDLDMEIALPPTDGAQLTFEGNTSLLESVARSHAMTSSTEQTEKKVTEIALLESELSPEELQRWLDALKEELRRLEEAKSVSQDTMQLEVSV